ncbi:hypothetical protein [Serratia sp. M24T3]|uniref:hypothetical protein n=1 Tax=Serratia sp. M24T3 TaxID=932213 RepID=UPI001ED912D0|nr:hypothetical protein [Serratia sp. M24T3]
MNDGMFDKRMPALATPITRKDLGSVLLSKLQMNSGAKQIAKDSGIAPRIKILSTMYIEHENINDKESDLSRIIPKLLKEKNEIRVENIKITNDVSLSVLFKLS